MKINGKTQTVILSRVYDGGAARIALENETLEVAYATKRLSDRERELTVCEPDALEFGAGGKGKAFFAAGWQTDPATGKRAWTIPCLACGVRSVAHDQDEAEAASLRQDRERRQRERLERERIDQAAATEAAQRRRQEQDDLRAIAASVGKLDPATAGGALLPGWRLNKLTLKACPNGNKKPGVFTYGRVVFTVPVGNAWDTVCDLIRANAFDGHGVKMKTPNEHFKREHRSFFTERLAKNESGWFIKTL